MGGAIVLAGFDEARLNGSLYEIPISPHQPVLREWSILYYHSSESAFALAAREVWLNKQRHFETTLVRSTPVVFRAIQLCHDYVRATYPEAAGSLAG